MYNVANGYNSVGVSNAHPVAVLGSAITDIVAGSQVSLDFSGSYDSDGAIDSYLITQTAGDTVVLTGAGDSRTYTAPEEDYDQDLVFQLIVVDDLGVESDPVTVTHSILAEASNTAPTVEITGSTTDSNAVLTAVVNDPDTDDIFTYEWEKVSGDAVLSAADTSSITVTSQQLNTVNTVEIRCRVNDGTEDSPWANHTITIPAVANQPPTANAGPDLPTVTAGAQFQLNGSGVANQVGAAIVGYSWAQISTGTVVALSNPLINNPTGLAPISDTPQTLTYELTVTDSNGLTAKDTVDVRVAAFVDTTPPVIVLEGGNIALNVGEEFQEPGYKAYDNQGNEITLNVVVTGSTETTFPRVGALEYNVTANGIAAETQTRIFTVTAESELLEEVSKQRFVLKDNKVLTGFAGRSNLEKIQFKLSSTNPAIALDKQGCYDFDENETQVVEVITPSGLISSANGDVEWEGSELYIRTGAFSSIKKHESARVVVYLANDTRGVVFAGPGLTANLIIHFN